MPNIPSPAPQKKPISAPQQGNQKPGKGQDVEKAKGQLLRVMVQKNIDPNKLVQLGDMALQAIQNKSLYPMVKDNALRLKLATQQEVGQGYNLQFLSGLASAGKLAKMIVEGK